MATKYLGLGTAFKIDGTTITLVINGTPPGRSRVLVDCTALDDTLQTYKMGMEAFSEFKFTQYWERGDTQHDSIDTAFGSKTDATWKIVYTKASTVDTFTGLISAISPATITHDQIYQREVTIQRTGAIATGTT